MAFFWVANLGSLFNSSASSTNGLAFTQKIPAMKNPVAPTNI
jgi:hypothetical protein